MSDIYDIYGKQKGNGYWCNNVTQLEIGIQ